jgi:hypothetical protein
LTFSCKSCLLRIYKRKSSQSSPMLDITTSIFSTWHDVLWDHRMDTWHLSESKKISIF